VTRKRIASRLDDTGNVARPEGNTNVLQLFRRIDYHPDRQLNCYDADVGTLFAAGAWTPKAQRL
jgi:uncharacterized protein (DUF2235 family)